jgi:hypothetical protein
MSWIGHLGLENWDRTAETGKTGQVGLLVTWTGQPGHDNVWKKHHSQKFQIFAKIFAKTFLKMNIFV